MKNIALSVILCFAIAFAGMAQESYTYKSSNVKISKRGEDNQVTTESPVVITVDHKANTFTLKTSDSQIKSMLNNKSSWKIEETMGEISNEYSVRIDANTFVHFHLDSKMIIISRNDIHPKQWGLLFKGITSEE